MEETVKIPETVEEGEVAAADAADQAAQIEATESFTAVVLPELQTETKKDARLKIFGVEFAYLFFLGIVMAFIGWIAENVVRIVSLGVMDSRFHVLPFIPIYGLVVFAVHILFGDPSDLRVFGKRVFKEKNFRNAAISNILCLLIMYAAVFLGELVVGNAWEAISGVQLWNYESLPLHVTQYAGLIPTLGYGTGAYLLARFCFCPAIRLLQKKANYKIILFIDYVLGALLLADELAMVLQIVVLGQSPVYWSIHLR